MKIINNIEKVISPYFTNKLHDKTMKVSLYVQFLAFLVGLITFKIKIKNENKVLYEIIFLETGVQLVEFIFYVFFSLYINTQEDFAHLRYYDWVITTPTMLLSSIMFFEYMNNKELKKINTNNKNNTSNQIYFDIKEVSNLEKTRNFIIENKSILLKIFLLNTAMLAFGYLGQINIMDLNTSVFLGSLCFAYYFYLIYVNYIKKIINNKEYINKTNNYLFIILLSIWSIYGVAALFSKFIKNSVYNILDIFSKNFYSLYLAYFIFYVANN